MGSARGQAMGGAFGALGGDITGIMINPAGLAIYRSAELSITADLNHTSIKADWNGISNKDSKTSFDVSNLSYVFYIPIEEVGIENINFGFSYNCAKNFNTNISARGGDMATSLTDYIADATSGYSSGQLLHDGNRYNAYLDGNASWLSILGYNVGIIDETAPGSTNYEPTGLGVGQMVKPRMDMTERGKVDTYDFSGGINFGHNLYLGAAVSLMDIDYTMRSTYSESFGGNTYYIDNYLNSTGYGVQVKVGAIWRPIDILRLGVSYHTPTYYSMTDYYQAWGEANYGPGAYDETPYADYRYDFQSPYGWTFSGALVLGKDAIISADWDIKDYSSMKLEERDGRELSANKWIEEDYRMASTVRLGAEYRFLPQLSGRIGYAWMQNPYAADIREGNVGAVVVGTVPHYMLEGDANYYTIGLGYRLSSQFYIDLAYVHKSQTDKLYAFPMLYDQNGDLFLDSKAAKLKNNTSRALITLGYKF
jgi:Long-chain fatty acid transport protein